MVLQHYHESPIAGHAGTHKTHARIKREFFWNGMHSDVRTYIRECDVCQRNKSENIKPAGLLQPLPIPKQAWVDISMDFIDGLPISKGYSVIMVVIDRFSKYSHFIPLSHPYTAMSTAQQLCSIYSSCMAFRRL